MSCNLETYATGTNARVATIGRVRVWFSYRTPVAFSVDDRPPVVRRNAWGPTTGRHLNAIDGGDGRRIDGDAFETALSAIVSRFADADAFDGLTVDLAS